MRGALRIFRILSTKTPILAFIHFYEKKVFVFFLYSALWQDIDYLLPNKDFKMPKKNPQKVIIIITNKNLFTLADPQWLIIFLYFFIK